MARNRNNKKQKKTLSFYMIIISLIILLIPISLLAVSGIRSLSERGNPVVGDRFKNDHDPKITDADIENLTNQIKQITGIEDARLRLTSSTLRVYVYEPNISTDNLGTMQKEIYNEVDSVLKIEDYFTSNRSQKQYDLEIHIFNQTSPDEDYFYALYTKNANMSEATSQVLTTPMSQEMVDFFIEEEENRRKLEEELSKEQDPIEEGNGELEDDEPNEDADE